ncbi:uncharacterized protein [Rutidosis leptorrhynchoides]|uniref:uncharacterized protein n=1 Tax=Rutidosis leptorrhynchoides TaxID=125765 RepID=UPI003A99B37C
MSVEMESADLFDADQMWNRLASTIRDVTKESLGVEVGTSRAHKGSREQWWFSDEVQTKAACKQARFRELLTFREGTLAERTRVEERYKEARREAKKVVALAMDKAYEDLYRKLDSKEGANDIYRIAKARERRRRDLDNIIYIKDEVGYSIVREDDIRKRWEGYFSSFFSEDGVATRQNLGPDQIPIEVWRCLGDDGVRWLTNLFNTTFRSTKMSMEWRLSEVIPIYKNKGDAQICSNYRVIKLPSHTMKLCERVIETRGVNEPSRAEPRSTRLELGSF